MAQSDARPNGDQEVSDSIPTGSGHEVMVGITHSTKTCLIRTDRQTTVTKNKILLMGRDIYYNNTPLTDFFLPFTAILTISTKI